MHKNVFSFALAWYLAAIYSLVFSLFFLVYISFNQFSTHSLINNYNAFRAQPSFLASTNNQEVVIEKEDARVLLVRQFFIDRKSPLADSASKFVEVADKYGLDFRLMPSIAMHESKGGKIMPKDSFNPFGYGIYGGKVMRFSSFEEGIERVGLGLKRDYIDQGLKTPYEIMIKYTPPSLAKGGPWAISVSTFMEELL